MIGKDEKINEKEVKELVSKKKILKGLLSNASPFLKIDARVVELTNLSQFLKKYGDQDYRIRIPVDDEGNTIIVYLRRCGQVLLPIRHETCLIFVEPWSAEDKPFLMPIATGELFIKEGEIL